MANRSTMQSRSSVMTYNKDNISYLNDSKNTNTLGLSINERINYTFKIILIGDSSVGKTSVIQRYIHNTFEKEQMATVNMDLKVKSVIIDANTSAELNIWDTCGEERFKALTKQYYKNANGIILLYNVNYYESFSNLSKWLQDCQAYCDDSADYFIIGNKADLERNVPIEEVEQFSKENDIQYKEISALTGLNVHNVFEILITKMIERKRRESIYSKTNEKIVKLDKDIKDLNDMKEVTIKQKKFGCC